MNNLDALIMVTVAAERLLFLYLITQRQQFHLADLQFLLEYAIDI